MRDIATGLRRFLDAGTPFALATTVSVLGSSPRAPGAVMAVDAHGEVLGSLTGGCVEAAVYAALEQAMADGVARVETYGIDDDAAYAVGLTCGGVVTVLVQPVDDALRDTLIVILDGLDTDRPMALATVVDGPAPLGSSLVVEATTVAGSLGAEGLDAAVGDDARGLVAAGHDATRHYGPNGERRIDNVAVFVQVFAPPARMLVFGAIDFAAAVARLGVFLGYRVTVCDARPVFATRRRFPDAHEVVVAWPHDYLATTRVDERSVIAVLTHDPKFDVPLLELALRGPAAYVGAMGSRRTHEDRVSQLVARGVSESELARLHSPIGLDLGARTPEETAVSIAAEITRVRWGGTGRPLSEIEGGHPPSSGCAVTAGILLAAGGGSRIGMPKALISWEGRLLVDRGITLLADGGCSPVIVVLGAAAARVRELAHRAALTVVADDWALGMGASLAAGLRAAEATDADTAIVALVDQPLVGVEAVRRLVNSGARVAVADYDGESRNPVLLGREYWAEVGLAVAGTDQGARRWLAANPTLVTRVDCTGTGSPDDLDTPADLDRLRTLVG